ncbi:MAG: hypothetical protein HYZ53_04505 [Planctomycetes bacterium]|nr:hypothetical protein [Planctomycetota bacterium]
MNIECQVCGGQTAPVAERCGRCGARRLPEGHRRLELLKFLLAEVVRWREQGTCEGVWSERVLAPYKAEYDAIVEGLLAGEGAGARPRPGPGAIEGGAGLTAEDFVRRAARDLRRRWEALGGAPGAGKGEAGTPRPEEDYFRRLIEAKERRLGPSATDRDKSIAAGAGASVGVGVAAAADDIPVAELVTGSSASTIADDAPGSGVAADVVPQGPVAAAPRAGVAADGVEATGVAPDSAGIRPPGEPRAPQPRAPGRAPAPAHPPPRVPTAADAVQREADAERKLRWILNLGIYIFAVAATVHVYNQWQEWTAGQKMGSLVFATLVLCVGGAFLKRTSLLRTTGSGIFILGTLFFPIDLFGAVRFGLIPPAQADATGLLGGLVCAAAYGTLARLGKESFFAHLAGLAGLGAWLFGLRCFGAPAGHLPAFLPLLALAYHAVPVRLRERSGGGEEVERLLVQPLRWISLAAWLLAFPALFVAVLAEWLPFDSAFGVLAFGLLGCAAYALEFAWAERAPLALWPAALTKAVLAFLALSHADVPVHEWGLWLMPLGTAFWAGAAVATRRLEASYLQPYFVTGALVSVVALFFSAEGYGEHFDAALLPPLMGTLAWPTAAFLALAALGRSEAPAYPGLIGVVLEYVLLLVLQGPPVEHFPAWLAVGQIGLTFAWLGFRRTGWTFLERPGLATVHLLGIASACTLLARVTDVYEAHPGAGVAGSALLAGSYWIWTGLLKSEGVACLAALPSAAAYVFALRWAGVEWQHFMLWFDAAALVLLGVRARGPAFFGLPSMMTGHLLVAAGIVLALYDLGEAAGSQAAVATESGRAALSGLLAAAFYALQSLRGERRPAEVAALAVLACAWPLALRAIGADVDTIRPCVMLLAAGYCGLSFVARSLPGQPFVEASMGVGMLLVYLDLGLTLFDFGCYGKPRLYCPILTCGLAAALLTGLCFVKRPTTWPGGGALALSGALLLLVTYLLTLERFSTGSIYGGIAVFAMSPALAGAGWAMRRRGMEAEWRPFVGVAVLTSYLALFLSLPHEWVRMIVCFACSAFYGAIALLFEWRAFSFFASLSVVGGYFSILQGLHVDPRLYPPWLVTLALGKVVTGSILEAQGGEDTRQRPMVAVGLGMSFLALGALVINVRSYVGQDVWVGIGVALLCSAVYVAAWLFQKKALFLYLSCMSLVGAYYIYAFHKEWTAWEAYTLPIAALILVWGHLVARGKWGPEDARSLEGFGIAALVGPSILQSLDASKKEHTLAAVLLGLGAVFVGMPLKKRAYVYGGTVGFALAVLIRAVHVLIDARLSTTAYGMLIGAGIFALAALLEIARRRREQAIARGEGGVRAVLDRWFEGWE